VTVAFKIPQITTEIGPGGLLHSLFSTIAYHLESGNWGSKYPVIMNNLYNGKLEAKNAKEAFIEVRAIKEQLELLSPDKVIWNIEDLSEKAPWGSEIGDHIKNVAMFYITKNGLNLVDELVDNIQDISNNGGNLEIISYEGDHPPFST